jgi:hypothetical protein
MSKCRHALANALVRLFFDKPLSELDRAEAMKLNFLRTLSDQPDEDSCNDAETASFEDRGATYH